MKKLTIIAVAVLAPLLSISQADPRFTIGSKFSFGNSYITPNNAGFHSSWAAGLTTAYQLTERFSVGVDALYSSEGGKVKINEGLANITAIKELDYLRVPVKAIYFFNDTEKDFRPKISAGPTFGVLMAEGTGYKDFDFGLSGALGFNWRMLEGFWLSTDVNYYHGLSDISSMTPEADHNRNLRLDIGLIFGL